MKRTSMKYIKLFKEAASGSRAPIILIGPQGSGKSTTAKALAKELGLRLIETDLAMIEPEYEEACGSEPGVEVEITRGPGGGVSYSSNKEYEYCVIQKIFDRAPDSFVLDVGGSHAHWQGPLAAKIKSLFGSTPNLFLFGVDGSAEEEYRFLKARREGRGEPIRPEQEAKFRATVSELRHFWAGAKHISIIGDGGREKNTAELVAEIKKNLA